MAGEVLPPLRAGAFRRGTLMVAEVASRFEDTRAFVNAVAQLGFKSVSKVCPRICPMLGALAARDQPSCSGGRAAWPRLVPAGSRPGCGDSIWGFGGTWGLQCWGLGWSMVVGGSWSPAWCQQGVGPGAVMVDGGSGGPRARRGCAAEV